MGTYVIHGLVEDDEAVDGGASSPTCRCMRNTNKWGLVSYSEESLYKA